MPSRSGRHERRTPLAVPVQISRFREPSASERTITESVCSGGLRVVAQTQMNPDESLLVSSTTGDLRVQARVVYCQRLRDGRFRAIVGATHSARTATLQEFSALINRARVRLIAGRDRLPSR